MVNPFQLSDKAIGLLSQNSLLVTQIQVILPDVIVFNSQDIIFDMPLDALLIDDAIDDFFHQLDKITFYDVPTILLTDLPTDQLTKALDAGIIDYISKPISSKLLEHRLSQLIDSIQPVSSLHQEDIQHDANIEAFLLDKLPDAFVSTDTDYIIMNWNKSAEQLYGWRAEEVIGQRLYGLLPTIYVDSSRDDVASILNSGKTWRGELIQSDKFGEKIHIFASSNCIVDEFGEIQGYVTMMRDNTDYQALIEQSLVSTETEYQSILASMTDPIFVFDSEGTYRKIPTVQTSSYYLSPENMLGKQLHDLFPKETANRFLNTIQTALDTQSVQILEYDLPIENRRAYFSSVINPIAGRDEVVWVSRDITHAKRNELAIQETEKRYRQLFENANDMILMIDLETGRVLDANKQTQKQLGYSQSELMRLNLTDIEQPLQDTESHIITRTLVTSGHIIVEQIYNRKDGTIIPVEISIRLIDYQGRKVLLSFARNIEQRKLAMQAQAEERFFAEALGDTISQLASALTMSDVLDVMISTAAKVVDCESIHIMLIEGDTAKTIRIQDHHDLTSQLTDIHIPSTFTLQHMRDNKQSILISDVENDSRWVTFTDENRSKSYIGAPIILKGEVIGFINLDSSKPHYFTNKHHHRLQAFADQATIAIENAQFYEASQRYTEDLHHVNEELQQEIIIRQHAEEAERQQRILAEALQSSISALNNTLNIDAVLDAVLDAMKLSVEHDASNIMLIDGKTLIVARQRGYPSPLPNKIPLNAVGDVPVVYSSKKSLIIRDTQSYELWKDDRAEVHGEIRWIRSNIKVPIIYDDEVIGILLLDSAEPNKFTMEHDDLLQTFANQASIAIQNARLYQAERQQRILAEALQDSITAMNSTLDIDVVLDAVLDAMQMNVEHDATNLMLIEGEMLKVVRHRGYEKGIPATIPLSEFEDARTIQQSQQALIIKDTRTYDRWMGYGDVDWVRSTINAPIIYDNVVIGIINVDSSEPNKYTLDDATLLQTFANQVSIAVQNARLYQQAQQEIAEHKQTQQQLQKRSAELELLREASLQLNATFKLIDIFKTTADYALKLINADCAHLFLYDGESLHFGIGLWDNTYQDHPYMPIRSDGMTYSVARTGEIIVVNSMIDDYIYDNKRVDGAIAGIPLKVKGEVRGVMNISYFSPHQFTDDELRAMGLLADQSAIAIQNSEHLRLLEAEIYERKRAETAEREQRIFAETLRDTAITLNQQLNTDELFETIIRAVEQVITVHDTASIIAMNPDHVTGIVVKDRGFDKFGDPVTGLVLDLTGSKARSLIERQTHILIADTHDSDLWIHVEETAWIRSHISLPIYIKDDILALINLDSQYPNMFTPQHIDRLTAFSHQAAIALRNAQLVEQIQGYTHELESKVQERTLELENERVLLQLERSQLRAILDAMRDGVYYTNDHHDPTYINNALSEMTGYSTDDWLSGRVFEDINRNENIDRDELWQDIERHLNINRFWQSESIVTRADGTQFEASLIRTEVKGIDNKRVGIVTVVRNISLQKQLAEQKSRFIANAAHELRTPITNIKTRLYLMKHKPEKFLEHLAIAESATNWMQSLVDNLFDQSRFERGIIRLDLKELVLQDLMSVVVETQQPEANEKNIKIIPDWDDSPIIITGDISRLRQVVTNLINNAINYTAESGLITVSLHQEMLASTTVAIISVRDTGIGIDAKHLPYLFQPFYQATDDSKGAGLGLSIAREIIEAHKGTIHIASKVGEGTTFYINLPLLTQAQPSEET